MSEQATAQTAARANKHSHAGVKVTVACKMETGLRLAVYKMVEEREPTPMGPRDVTVARFEKEAYVNGVGKRFEAAPRCEVVAGFALTHGIEGALWDRWVADNINSPMVENHLIFAHEDADYLRGWCREHAVALSGTQQLSGGDDPRAPKAALKVTDEDGRAKASPRIMA
jgi:hypothetical protein